MERGSGNAIVGRGPRIIARWRVPLLSLTLATAPSACEVANKDDFEFASLEGTSDRAGATGAPEGASGGSGAVPSFGGGPATGSGGGGGRSDGSTAMTTGGIHTNGGAGGRADSGPMTDGAAGAESQGAAGDAGAPVPGADPDPELEPECQEGAVTCAEIAGREILTCEEGAWVRSVACAETEVCLDATGECAPIPSECVGRPRGARYCVDQVRYACADDLASVVSEACEGLCIDGECAPATCGDGIENVGEECDDGNDSNADACTTACRRPVCGNGVKEGSEQCDDGNSSSADDCTTACKLPVCGDGSVQPDREQCDDGNTTSGDGCSASCRSEVKSIRLGRTHGCALFENGDLRCWGANAEGQLGANDASGSWPVVLTPVTSFATGPTHTCALKTGKLYCWGTFYINERLVVNDSPKELDIGASSVREIYGSAVGQHHCALVASGSRTRLKCWGHASAITTGAIGVVGDFDPDDPASYPFVQIADDVKDVGIGSSFTCALLTSGLVQCWGFGFYGQLGRPLDDATCTSTYCFVPGDEVALGSGFSVAALASGVDHTCALGTGGAVKCWGRGRVGQLGVGDTTSRGVLVEEMGDALPAVDLAGKATAVATGATFSCARLTDGAVKCWGNAFEGRLAQPQLTGSSLSNHLGDMPGELGAQLPAINLGPNARAIQIAAGEAFACALLDNRQVKCWGSNAYGQLGVQTGDAIVGDGTSELGASLQAIAFD